MTNSRLNGLDGRQPQRCPLRMLRTAMYVRRFVPLGFAKVLCVCVCSALFPLSVPCCSTGKRGQSARSRVEDQQHVRRKPRFPRGGWATYTGLPARKVGSLRKNRGHGSISQENSRKILAYDTPELTTRPPSSGSPSRITLSSPPVWPLSIKPAACPVILLPDVPPPHFCRRLATSTYRRQFPSWPSG